ncbi:MAG: shikimate dehydrogenase, partial [Candidatus Aegiribacteria sp.]
MGETTDKFKLGLVGWPLERTLSPAIHEEFFRSTGLSGEYSAFPVRPGTLESSLAELFSGGIRGLNVTFPYKMESAGLCDELEGDALRLGAVNTLEHSGGVL